MGCELGKPKEQDNDDIYASKQEMPHSTDNLHSESPFMKKEELFDFIGALQQKMKEQNPAQTKEHTLSHELSRKSKDSKTLRISNEKLIKRRQQYTSLMRNDLDPRDKQLIIPFSFTVDISKFQTHIQSQRQRYSDLIKDINPKNKIKMIHDYIESIKFTNSQWYEELMREIQEFLSNMCENVASVTFRLLAEQKLADNQAKAFASKNFLVNIHALMLEVKEAVRHFMKQEDVQDIIAKITTDVDQSLMRVLESILEHYPQAPAAGQTARMRDAIINVNRAEDEANDLILNRDIRIEKYLNLDENRTEIMNQYENYTGFIMEVINSAINVTRDYFSAEQATVFERFVQFSQRLFCTSQHKHFRQVLHDKTDPLIDYYLKVLAGHEIEVDASGGKDISSKKKLPAADALNVIKAEYEENIQKMREGHKYAVAQKIPNYVKPFSRNQLRGQKFVVGSSSILRIMTKWAQNLEQIFKKPQLYISHRLHNYKSISNELFAPTDAMNRILTERLAVEYEAVKLQFGKLKQQNTLLQSYILSHNQTGIDSYLKRFTEVRSASSQINASLIQIMHKYLCVLIHHLLKAGERINTGSSLNHINLVVFKVNDLLRSKFQCNQSTFINVLHTLALLDRSREMEGKFRMVRLKNKLNQKDNNVLINYMFLGRVQCELQLSVQQTKGKAKDYYNFNHFLYQLIRGKFGAITQCAIIVSQHDPVVNSCRDDYYRPKKYHRRLPPKPTFDEQNMIQFKRVHQKDSSLFICSKCKHLMVNHNVELFNCKESICNPCLMAMDKPEEKLKDVGLRNFLVENLGQRVKKVKKFSELQKDKYVLYLGSTGRSRDAMKLYRVWQNDKDGKIFLLQLTKELLANFDSPSFQHEEFNFFDIQPLQEKKASLKDLNYLFGIEEVEVIFQLHGIDRGQVGRIDPLMGRFQDYLIEKNLVEAIKSKQEILDMSADPKQYHKFLHLLQEEMKRELQRGQDGSEGIYFKGVMNVLRMSNGIRKTVVKEEIRGTNQMKRTTSFKNIEYNSLKKLHLTQLALEKLPQHLLLLPELTQISLESNKFKEVDLRPFSSIKCLNLSHNLLEYLDVSSLRHLTHLYLDSNKLSTIDLTNNPSLSEVSMDNNQLSGAIFRFNPQLKFTLDNQRSSHCRVNLRFRGAERGPCEQLRESMRKECAQGWANQHSCKYVFEVEEDLEVIEEQT